MEDILNLYELDYDPLNPLITFDERPCHLIDNVYQPLPMKEGQPKREDYHVHLLQYVHGEQINIWMIHRCSLAAVVF